MRDFGTITEEGNGLQGAGMVYASVNGSSSYKTNLKLIHMRKIQCIQRTHRPIFNFSTAKIVLLPLLSVILVTIGRWFTKMSSLKCVNFKFRSLFFNKSGNVSPNTKQPTSYIKYFYFSDCSYIRCKNSF